MIELIVVLAVILILAATITPSVIRRLDRARVESAASELDAIADAIHAFNDDLGETTGPPFNRSEYPASLTQLVNSVDGGDANICGNGYDGTDQGQWAGPYLTRAIPATGLPTAIGTVDVTLYLDTSGNDDRLLIRVADVTEEDVLMLDAIVDGDGDSAGGSVQWSSQATAGLVTLDYVVPVGSAC